MKHQIADNLVLRNVETHEDAEQMAAFTSIYFSDNPEQPDRHVGTWVRQMLSDDHPTMTWDDYYLVEDTGTGEIVSTLCLIPQTWSFDGIPFKVGRVEAVLTHPDYRRRGLVRRQFEALHERCADLGLPVQAITGITYYYRLFGYEYALELGGGPLISTVQLPDPPADLPYNLRDWQPGDLPHIQAFYNAHLQDKLVSMPRTPALWPFFFEETDSQNINHQWLMTITEHDTPIGYLALQTFPWGPRLTVTELALNRPYSAVIPWLVPRLRDEIPRRHPDATPPYQRIYFQLGTHHPVYPYLEPFLPYQSNSYAWYLRLPDTAGFVRQIAPALERRLTGTLAGLTQTLTIQFYDGGLRLEFEDGKLKAVENLPFGVEKEDAAFPPGVFLKLLFGYRSVEEITHAFPDAYVKRTHKGIFEALFPKRSSFVIPLY